MKSESVDVIVIGSAMGGSLLSTLLVKRGLTVAIVDVGTHPRFAIGESSTPLADRTLHQLAVEYGLPQLTPLCRYGTWKRTCPELMCGRKRGFSYFGHGPGNDLTPATISERRMLVAASDSDEYSDTHWLRSDVDMFLFRQAVSLGVIPLENARYRLNLTDEIWSVEGVSGTRRFELRSPFLVDATGAAGVVLNFLKVPSLQQQLMTHSRAIFAHFADVPSVGRLLQASGIDTGEHPFDCDAAAVHHVLDNGWMWQIRFDDDTLSAGILCDCRSEVPFDWKKQIDRFPFLQRQFHSARMIRTSGGFVRSGRMQRLASCGAGANWAALPNTVGFIDPLHSTGIAHSLSGVRQLATILSDAAPRQPALARYSRDVLRELRHVDVLIEGCYAALPNFRLWCAWCMLYFAAATSMEQDGHGPGGSFLLAADSDFCQLLAESRKQLQTALTAGCTEVACERFEGWLRSSMSRWNHVGLLHPACGGLYTSTAAVRSVNAGH